MCPALSPGVWLRQRSPSAPCKHAHVHGCTLLSNVHVPMLLYLHTCSPCAHIHTQLYTQTTPRVQAWMHSHTQEHTATPMQTLMRAHTHMYTRQMSCMRPHTLLIQTLKHVHIHVHTVTHACTLTPHTFIMHVHTITHTPHINHTGEHTDTATCTHLNVYVNTHVLL